MRTLTTMKHQALRDLVTESVIQRILDRPLPTRARICRNGEQVLVDTKTHRKIRNSKTIRTAAVVLH